MPSKKTNPTEPIPADKVVEGELVAEPETVATKPESRLSQLQKENATLREQASRALADYQNLERRQREERIRTVEYAKEEVFAGLLQPLEHLELAAKTIQDQGLDIVVKQFWEVLGEQGLTMLTPTGEKFDAEKMEAIEKVGEGEIVQEVVSPGFVLGNHVIKPAKVKVG